MTVHHLTPRAVAEIKATVLFLASMPDTVSVAARVGRDDDAEEIAKFPAKRRSGASQCVVWTDRSDGLRLEVTTHAACTMPPTAAAARELLAALVVVLATDTRCQSTAT